jgi:hypothetical protein
MDDPVSPEFSCLARTERVRTDNRHWLLLTRSPVAGFNPIRDNVGSEQIGDPRRHLRNRMQE